jgi:hypothetical protein
MKNFFLGLVLFTLALITPAYATCGDGSSTCWWIGASGNWNVNGSWSNSSGGASNGTQPATGDSICFDSGGSGNSTINATRSIARLDTTGTEAFCTAGGSAGAYTGTITQNAATTLTVTGATFNVSSSSGWTAANATTSDIAFTGTTVTINLNSSGASRNVGDVSFNGTGPFTLGSALTAAGTLTSTAGNLDFNNVNATAGAFDFSGTTARTITCGTGTLTANSTTSTAPWNVTTSTNLTLTCNTGTVVVSGATTVGRTITWGGKTYNNFTISAASLNRNQIALGGGSVTTTIANLTLTNVSHLGFASTNHILHVTGTFAWTGLSESAVGYFGLGVSNGSGFELRVNSVHTFEWLYVQNIEEHASSSNITFNNSFDGGNNTNITINRPGGSDNPRGMVIP